MATGLVEGADGQDGVEAVDGPVHAGACDAMLEDGFAGGLDGSRCGSRPAG